jgi:hypothetical protein
VAIIPGTTNIRNIWLSKFYIQQSNNKYKSLILTRFLLCQCALYPPPKEKQRHIIISYNTITFNTVYHLRYVYHNIFMQLVAIILATFYLCNNSQVNRFQTSRVPGIIQTDGSKTIIKKTFQYKNIHMKMGL